MSRDEFRAAVQRHGYRLADFADDFGISYDTVRCWGTRNGVPRWATRVLALMDQHGRAHVEGPGRRRVTSRSVTVPNESQTDPVI
jgi:hypothetical protein